MNNPVPQGLQNRVKCFQMRVWCLSAAAHGVILGIALLLALLLGQGGLLRFHHALEEAFLPPFFGVTLVSSGMGTRLMMSVWMMEMTLVVVQ